MRKNKMSLRTLLGLGLAVKLTALVLALALNWPQLSQGPEPVVAGIQPQKTIAKAQVQSQPAAPDEAPGQSQEQPQQMAQAQQPAKADTPTDAPEQSAQPDQAEDAPPAESGQAGEAAGGGGQPGQDEMNSKVIELVEQKQQQLALEEERIAREREELLKLRNEVNRRIDELKKVQASLEQLVSTERQERRKRILQLVKVLSNMRADAAGAVVAKLDDQMAVEIFSYMQSRQAGKVMSALTPDKAARVSLLLTRKQEAEEAARLAGDAAAKGSRSGGECPGNQAIAPTKSVIN
jgi:flagellar motility protein MotE (MotC chaperone)